MNLLTRIPHLILLFGALISYFTVHAVPSRNTIAQPFASKSVPKANDPGHLNALGKRTHDTNLYTAVPLSDKQDVYDYKLNGKIIGHLIIHGSFDSAPLRYASINEFDENRREGKSRAPIIHYNGIAFLHSGSKEGFDTMSRLPYTVQVLKHFRLKRPDGTEIDQLCTVFEYFSTNVKQIIDRMYTPGPLPDFFVDAIRNPLPPLLPEHLARGQGQDGQEEQEGQEGQGGQVAQNDGPTQDQERQITRLSQVRALWESQSPLKGEPVNRFTLLIKLLEPLVALEARGYIALNPTPNGYAIDTEKSDDPMMWEIKILDVGLMRLDLFNLQYAYETTTIWSSRGEKTKLSFFPQLDN